MARYEASIITPRTPAEVFSYLSDFASAAEWDPGVVEAERLDHGPLGVGSEFRVVAEFLRRRTALIYRILEYDPPRAVTLRAETATVVSLDRITFEPSNGGGTRVAYDARLALRGPLKLADPLLALAFNGVGSRALAGLRRTLAREPVSR